MKTLNLSKKGFLHLFLSIFTMVSIVSCGGPNESNPSGKYCSTVPNQGFCQDGYNQVSLEDGGECVISHCGHVYANHGTWRETEDGVIISGVQGDFSTYNGTYEWEDHIHGNGIGKPGKVLKLKGSGEIGTQLFPL